jgi:uncharacterized protein
MTTLDLLHAKRNEILSITARHGGKNVRVFGSVVRGLDKPNSDVDMLVDLEEGRTLFDLIGLQQDIEDLLERAVDLLTEKGINPRLREGILREARPL